MNNQEWRDWLEQSRMKQAGLNAMNQRNQLASQGRLTFDQFEPVQSWGGPPLRGNSGAGWAGPESVTPGTDWSAASFQGEAPGYSPNRGVRQWGDNSADDAFEARAAASEAAMKEAWAREALSGPKSRAVHVRHIAHVVVHGIAIILGLILHVTHAFVNVTCGALCNLGNDIMGHCCPWIIPPAYTHT